MILGRIIGKASTTKFSFEVTGEAKKFLYAQVQHKDYGYVLCQITELLSDYEKTIAYCNIIGYKEDGKIKQIRTPFEIGSEVLVAEDSMIEDVIAINTKNSAYIGNLEGKDIKISLDLQKLLTKHIAVLAKSGSGKSYTVAVLIEEILKKGLPVVVIDQHGEYYSLKYPNNKEKEQLSLYGLQAKGFFQQIVEYGNQNFNANFKQLKVSDNLNAQELLHIVPMKLTSAQEGLLYSVVKDMDSTNLDDIIVQLQLMENNAKFNLINVLDYLQSLDVFSSNSVDMNELVRPGKCSILNLKGIEPEAQQIIVYKLLKDMFNARKTGKLPPFFLVVEEAHNFVPEKTFGDAKSSSVLMNIASEGRKFGLGLCVISQRPARVQKSVLSQCSTQIILKVTNPNDLKAITTSVEGITYDTENEIVNLPVGTAMLTGIAEMPLFVNIRPRLTRHGGQAVELFEEKEEKDFVEEVKEYSEQLALVKPKTTLKDLRLMYDENICIKKQLVPAVMFNCKRKNNEFNILVELVSGKVLPNIEDKFKINIVDLTDLSKEQILIMEHALHLLNFTSGSLAKSTKMDVFQVESLANMFVKQGLFSFNGSNYTINDHLRLISHPQDYSCYEKVVHENVDFDKKFDNMFEADEIRKRLDAFVDVVDSKGCFILEYKIDKKKGELL